MLNYISGTETAVFSLPKCTDFNYEFEKNWDALPRTQHVNRIESAKIPTYEYDVSLRPATHDPSLSANNVGTRHSPKLCADTVCRQCR